MGGESRPNPHCCRRKKGSLVSKWLEKEVVRVLDKLGKKACKKFGYEYSNIKRLHANDKDVDKVYGYYIINNREIRVAIKKSATRFYPMESLVDTLMHEIAHTEDVDHLDDPDYHSCKWRARYRELKRWARKYIYD